ncbi:enoyl-CoA hydratase-related protein [Thermodesulfobacteriota bacterium]
MSYENLLTEIGDDFVADITLNRPDQLNTFNTPLAGELVQALEELDADTNVRVIIVKGAGKAFYAAADLDYHKAFEYMNEAFARLCTTEDAKEGVNVFFEKRIPEWKLR